MYQTGDTDAVSRVRCRDREADEGKMVMARIVITMCPALESKYELADGQEKVAYWAPKGKLLALRTDREVWVTTAIRGERARLFQREFEWVNQ